MNSSNFSKSARKSAIAVAIAFAAAAPALAGSGMQNYSAVGYPVGEAMDFELPSMRTAQVAVATQASAQAEPSSVAGADAPAAYGQGVAKADENLIVVSVAQLPQRAQSPVTRESVRADLIAAREAGTVTQANEAGDTQQILAARDAANDAQGQMIVAEYEAEYERQMAMAVQEAEIRLAAIEAARPESGYALAPTSIDDPMAEVQIDVISIQPDAVGE